MKGGSTALVFWVVLIFLFGSFRAGCGEGFISWDDLKVDVERGELEVRDLGGNRSRVIVVDQSGKGDSVTVQGAVDMVPLHNSERVKIFILPGIYREKVFVPSVKPYISFIGDENRSSETVITWNNKASDKAQDGGELGTYNSASVAVESDYFCASGLTFENSIVAEPGGYGMQAVALRLSGDKALLYRVRILGTQDTLLDDQGSHYFYECFIQGSIDFIFGSARSLYRNCALHSIAQTFGAIAAHHRDSEEEDTGYSFVNCAINGTGSLFLGRAWGEYSRVIYSFCDIDDIIIPGGWSDWDQPPRQRTAVFGEYQSRGRGARGRKRVAWAKSFSFEDVRPFLDWNFIGGQQWLKL